MWVVVPIGQFVVLVSCSVRRPGSFEETNGMFWLAAESIDKARDINHLELRYISDSRFLWETHLIRMKDVWYHRYSTRKFMTYDYLIMQFPIVLNLYYNKLRLSEIIWWGLAKITKYVIVLIFWPNLTKFFHLVNLKLRSILLH